jgi:hypothetical protein
MDKTAYVKQRTTAEVGDTLEIPGSAEAITITAFSPFGETVQVSWLQPADTGTDSGVVNHGVLHSHSAHYTDDDPVEIPYRAWAVTVHEPLESTETVVYWLD